MNKNSIILVFGIIFLSLIVSSVIPGTPHQFYGGVTICGEPLLSGEIVAKIDGEVVETGNVINGKYGYENIFMIDDPENIFTCELIEFYIGGELVGHYQFQSAESTKLDFEISGCEESQLSCIEAQETGLLTAKRIGNQIFVVNNAGADYEIGVATYKMFDNIIDNQEIYDYDTATIDGGSSLNLSVEFPDCAHQIDVFCGDVLMSLDGQRYGTRLFSNFGMQLNLDNFCEETELYCGDGICNNGETCQTCEVDCGTCETPECVIDSDCNADYYGDDYCSSGDVFRKFYDYSCIQGACNLDITSELVKECSEDCNDGECVDNGSSGNGVFDLGVSYCDPNWECGAWSECYAGIMTRKCVDTNNCDFVYNKPYEESGCGMILPSYKQPTWWPFILFGLLLTLLLILTLVIILRKK